jgi:hypothetical protein
MKVSTLLAFLKSFDPEDEIYVGKKIMEDEARAIIAKIGKANAIMKFDLNINQVFIITDDD